MTRMLIVRVLIFVTAIIAQHTVANACNCFRGNQERMKGFVKKVLKQPGAVLVEAEVVADSGAVNNHQTTFKVIDTWIGSEPSLKAGGTLTARHNTTGAACGVNFKIGEKTLLLANRDQSNPAEDGYSTSLCDMRMSQHAKAWGKVSVQDLVK